MIVFWICAGVLLLLGLLWLLALCAKRRKSGFFGLESYHYAHRGLHDSRQGVPENSLSAFRLAVQAGYGAELDVHLSQDGRLVVMHDESLKRTAGVERNICDMTAQELDACRLEGTEEKIPYLEEVLPLFAGKTPLVVEIKPCKGNHARLTELTCRLLDRFPEVSYCIESFDPRVLFWLRRHRPQIVRGQLSCNFLKDRNNLAWPLAFLLTNLLTGFLTLPHFIAYRFSDRRNPSLRLCRRLWGVQEFSWTIRSPEEAEEALKDGCLIIFEHCRP